MLDVLLQLAASPTLGQIVVFDDVPELQSVGGLNRLFCGDALPCDQADELAQEHLAVLAGESHGRLVVAAVFDAFDQRAGFDLDLHVLYDQRPERVIHGITDEKLVSLAGVAEQALQVRFGGLTKNTAQLATLFALSNLWMARRHLLAGAGEVRL